MGGGEGEDGEGSGERTRAAREAALYSTAWAAAPAGGGGGDARDGRYDDGTNGEDGGNEEGIVVTPITPATRGRRGGEYVSTRTHPLTPHPAYTPTLLYLWVCAGIIAIPAQLRAIRP